MKPISGYFGEPSGVAARKKWFKKEDYIPLDQRSDWSGEVIEMTQEPDTWHRNFGRVQGKQARRAGRKTGTGG